MKLGDFEGTTEEFSDVCKNHGFDPSQFLNPPKLFRVKTFVLVIAVVLFTAVNIVLWTTTLPGTWYKTLIIFNLTMAICIAIAIHLRFDKTFVTVLVFVGCLLLLSISLSYISPKEAINEMKKNVLNKNETK